MIKKAVLDFVTALKSTSNSASNVNIRHNKIDELQLVWPKIKLWVFNAKATLTSENKLESARVKTADGKLSADVTTKATPNGDEQLIVVNVDKWTLPVGLPLLFDKATVEMHLKGSRLTIPNKYVALYSGELKNDAVASLLLKQNQSGSEPQFNVLLSVLNVSGKQY